MSCSITFLRLDVANYINGVCHLVDPFWSFLASKHQAQYDFLHLMTHCGLFIYLCVAQRPCFIAVKGCIDFWLPVSAIDPFFFHSKWNYLWRSSLVWYLIDRVNLSCLLFSALQNGISKFLCVYFEYINWAISPEVSNPILFEESPCIIVVNVLNCDILVREFELQPRYYVHFRTE